MSHLPPNKGTKLLSAAVVMAILGTSTAMASHASIKPPTESVNSLLNNAHRNAKGDFIRDDFNPDVNLEDLWATSEANIGKSEGTTTDKLYKSLKEMGLNADKEIIVAVIDSGVDITHEDLQGHIWENSGEIGLDAEGKDKRFNGKDDDNDGFIDDVNGWNFIGAVKDGKKLNSDFNTLEVAREAGRLEKLQASGTLSGEDPYYQAVEKNYKDRSDSGDFPKECFRKDFQASTLIGDDATQLQAVCVSDSIKGAQGCLKNSYGNSDVSGRDANGKPLDPHGTHVAGIIAALRDNVGTDGKNKGIQGQATNVKIMSIRAVPGCDERDKDIANAIRFAVDHGAKVINMSFGKNFSPNKDWVDAAAKYAESKDVLLVHAAGNEHASNEGSRTITKTRDGNYPNQFHFDSSGRLVEVASNWLEVGASSQNANSLPAYFTNYGKTSVDLFAPGYDIVSTVPSPISTIMSTHPTSPTGYQSFSGTSMASPETAGVVALLRSIFPDADYATVRKAIVENTSQYPGVSVSQPGTGSTVAFSNLSTSGGIVNAYEAAVALKSARTTRSLTKANAKPTTYSGNSKYSCDLANGACM